ncbi:AGE family epimerase/isomerase [Gilvimarinus agarilyticus]|uniref:AGE family epimerase/isomerase n=1 Tax=Gilvimarinus sp. 2_MG-2023 TaxID=3062666 RepID=UPI001C08E387|nr:AGE family epimerase/isomerase [Gilvimarinus sp. 2_MG-2023]MBU2884405.1 AGE family epimerase/isomerase [Gilvimarinus agarilyticus]MDO6569541.1 AGE family epimerase/isomerase [Gilvimarinus sp. 2_MG-2023]
MSHNLTYQSQRLSHWVQRDAIPVWLERGIHPELGASVERLTAHGQADTQADVRVRVQARQAFFFTACEALGWCADGAAIGAGMLKFVETCQVEPSVGGGFPRLLSPEFKVCDFDQDLYDHAFFLLAYAWQYRVTKDASVLAKADALMQYLDRAFASPYGGWSEGNYVYKWRRQNPHMHLFEAFMALYEASGDRQWLLRAGHIFDLFERFFFCAKQGVLQEYFFSDWRLASGADGQIIEPGHMFEWVWLLDWYQRLSGRDLGNYLQILYRRAYELGYQSDSGLVCDSVTAAGGILQQTKRCWGLTEMIKACLVMAEHGDPEAEALAAVGIESLFTYYLCGITPGTYVDQRGADDEIVVDTAPASTLYHLMVLIQHLQAFLAGREAK